MNEPSPNLMTEPYKAPSPLPRPASAPSGMRLRHLMYAVFFVALFLASVITFGLTLLIFGFVLGPALVIGPIVIVIRRRSIQQDALLSVLAIAAERLMPLAPGVAAFAELCGGSYRLKVLRLSRFLEKGVPLPDALLQVRGVLPRSSILLIRTGWETGRLAEALRLAADARASRAPFVHSTVLRLAYLAGMLFVIQVVVGFLLYFIMPKIEAIFADFGAELPQATIWIIRASHILTEFPVLPILIALEVAFLLTLPWIYGLWMSRGLPLIDRVFRRPHTTLILRCLALTVEAEQPMAEGLRTLSRFYPQRWMRKTLRKAYERVCAGTDWCRALWAARLISRTEAAVLDAAQRAGNLSWALRELAEAGERRFSMRIQAWSQVLFALVVLGLGALVFLFAVAYFSPLITLIENI